ncbi:glycosyltransferase family 32 protein [Pseudomonas sp. SDO524_S393]
MAIRFPVDLVSILNTPVIGDKKTNNPPSHEGAIPSSEAPGQTSFPTVPDQPLLGKNDQIESYLKSHAFRQITPESEVSKILASKINQRWGLNTDPDKTYLVTFEDSARTEKNVVEKVTLTQAALKNLQGVPVEDNKNWLQKFGQYVSPLIFAYNKVEEVVESSRAEQGIYHDPASAAVQPYSESTRVDIPVADFKTLVWDTDRPQLYKNALTTFWEKQSDAYTTLSRMAFVKAIKFQSLEGSLEPEAVELAQRAIGPIAKKPWTELSVQDFEKRTLQDPDLDIGLVSVNGMKSTDLLCVTDKKTQLTLLYVPGNSSPLHRFDNPQQMGVWLAKQAADPNKRVALMTHFSLEDQADKTFSDGVHQSLQGLGAWSTAQEAQAFSPSKINAWLPEQYINVSPLSGDPFQEVMTLQKARSFSDADNAIVSDSDYTKAKITQGLEEAAKVALFMTPLALAMPEVALAMDAFYLGAGITETTIGIDDVAKGKSTGADRIVFGVLNAVPPVVVHGGGALAGALKPESTAVAHSIPIDETAQPFLRAPQRVNGQIGYPMGPVEAPALSKSFDIPMDDVMVSPLAEYSVAINGYLAPAIYDLEAGAWRGFDLDGNTADIFYWREVKGEWTSGTKAQMLANAEKRLPSVEKKVVTLPVLPSVPSSSTEIPKVIHYFWAGNEMPDHLVKNIMENARKSPGYKSIVHVDANNQSVFSAVKDALDHKVGGLEVHDMKADEVFRELNAGKYAELYQYFRSGQGQNLAASSDVMRAVLIKRYGGIYLDTDDALTHGVGEIALSATPNDVLLSSPVTYAPADFSGLNTSNFASHANNSVFDKILEEIDRRFKANKIWLDANRPFIGENPTEAELDAYKANEKKIFEVTGPVMFNDVLKQEKYGLLPVLDDLSEVLSGRLIAPDGYIRKLLQAQEYYLPMDRKFGVDIGAEHSMRHSR